MDYKIFSECGEYTPNGRQIDILYNGKTLAYALHIDAGELITDNKIIPNINQPRTEIIFSEYLEPLLRMDAGVYDECDKWDYTLYTEKEYNRLLNGYTPEMIGVSPIIY